ncbi:MAG: GFA family protein, partial [Hyphomicrobiales bacterium]
MKLSGGCFCGAVRYTVTGDVFNSTLCHCIDCR